MATKTGFEVLTAVAMKFSVFMINPEDGGDIFLRNAGCLSRDYAMLCSRWYTSSRAR
jgi:hypothetical protein